MTMILAPAALAAALLISQAPAGAPDDPSTIVVKAAATFSVGYGAWLWEKQCKTLAKAKGKTFDALTQDALKRLQDASDPKLFNAAVGAGRDVSSDPKFSGCTGKETEGFAEFGLDQMRDADSKLKSLPAGFHLTLTN
jgi:hypothetical protein